MNDMKYIRNVKRSMFISGWVSVCLALLFVPCGCNHRDQAIEGGSGSDPANKKADESYVLMRAKLFLHVFHGRNAYKMYTDPNWPPPKVRYFKEREIWNVFFNTAIGGVNIDLDPSAERANYLFPNGRVIKRDAGQEADSDSPPLYTLEEMVELLQLPHNRFD